LSIFLSCWKLPCSQYIPESLGKAIAEGTLPACRLARQSLNCIEERQAVEWTICRSRNPSSHLPLLLRPGCAADSAHPARRRAEARISKGASYGDVESFFFLEWFHASRLLLHVESRLADAACDFRRADFPFLPVDFINASVLRSTAPRTAFSMDVCGFWRLHRRLWVYTWHGNLDALAG